MFLFSALTIIAALMLACYYYAHSLCWITIAQPTMTYGGPSMQYHKLAEIPKNTLCYVAMDDGHWKCIKTRSYKGWLPIK